MNFLSEKIWCLKCKEDVNYTGWSDHCSRHHPVNNDADGNNRGDDDTDRPGRRAAGVGDVLLKEKKPKGGCGKKAAIGAAPKRHQKDSSGDKGTKCKEPKSL